MNADARTAADSRYAPSPHGMYLRHFGLRTAPFGITPDPAFFYTGNTRGALLDALLYAVTQGEGIIKLTGEVGSGKTMLCRMLAERLPAHVDVLYLPNPGLAPDEVAHAIAAELGLELPPCRADEVLRSLHEELISRHAAGRQVLLLAEEAQAMPVDTLEALRLLTNLETASHKLLQIVLFGQPELERTLDLPQLRQLKERITHSFTVPRLPPALLDDYLACRLAAAGRAAPLVFEAAALRQLARASQGIVRRINILADKALLAAYADDAGRIDARHLRLAIADSPFRPVPWHAGMPLARALIAVMLLLAGALLWQWLAPRSAAPAAAPARPAAPTHVPAQAMTAAAAPLAASAPARAPADSPTSVQAGVPGDAAGELAPEASRAPADAPADAPIDARADVQAAALARRPAPTPLLDSSLAASQAWLARQAPQQLVLQIASIPATDTAAAEAFLQQARLAIGLGDIHVFRVQQTRPGAMAPRLTIVYGSFADRASAEAVWARLATASPQKLLLSNIDSIRTEMKPVSQRKP
ncbi:AAA family ATPase [Janthinobacterium sp. GW458P]|uniref:ExeA family protein n=1 Tax=Janthinobacterium sp. GW458P TaxID=1981504 RepID=UPI001D02302E|nr:AAA family ATPase [Janthinobacterium sp. GW458P]